MTIRAILQFPDPRLRLGAAPVTVFDEALRSLADDLLETMRSVQGLGITASHIGVAQRMMAIQLPDMQVGRIYVNPSIVWSSPEMMRHEEASVSMPGVGDEMERPRQVRVQYQDLAGVVQTEEAEGLASICHQHEIDQLNGIFWIYRLSRLKRERLIKRYEKLRKFSALAEQKAAESNEI